MEIPVVTSVFAQLLLISLLLALPSSSLGISCKNADGQDVDWFAGYKFPKMTHKTNPMLQEGSGYSSFAGGSGGWSALLNISAEAGHPLAETLNGIYADLDNKEIFYLFYNDEQPAGPKSFNLGHTKSVLAFDSTSGVWLLHSIPRFPPSATYAYPHSGTHYGQSMLCVTFASDQLTAISKQLYYSQPFIYAAQVPAQFATSFPTLNAVITQNATAQQAPFIRATQLVSKGGRSFMHFSKSGKWGKDLYADGIAKQLNQDLLVESWRDGPGDMPSSSCQIPLPKVFNAEDITVVVPEVDAVRFKTSLDHSKFAVSSSAADAECPRGVSDNAVAGWTCIGDINRQNGQLVRGGGSMCSDYPGLWHLYSGLVDKFEPCAPVNGSN